MAGLPAALRLPVCDDKEMMTQQKRLYPGVFVDQMSAILLGLVNVAVMGTISSGGKRVPRSRFCWVYL